MAPLRFYHHFSDGLALGIHSQLPPSAITYAQFAEFECGLLGFSYLASGTGSLPIASCFPFPARTTCSSTSRDLQRCHAARLTKKSRQNLKTLEKKILVEMSRLCIAARLVIESLRFKVHLQVYSTAKRVVLLISMVRADIQSNGVEDKKSVALRLCTARAKQGVQAPHGAYWGICRARSIEMAFPLEPLKARA